MSSSSWSKDKKGTHAWSRWASSALIPFALLGALATSTGCSHAVRIRSEPAGAEIFVNGQSQGTSPVTYTETSSGGGTVEIKARLNGQEVTQQVPKDQVSWAAVGGVGGGVGGGACLALNAAGCVGFLFVSIFALPLNCLGLAIGVGVPLGVYFGAGQQMKEDIVISMPVTARPAAPPTYAPPPPTAGGPPQPPDATGQAF